MSQAGSFGSGGSGGSGITQINGNSGSVIPVAGIVTISGDGTILSTSGSGSTLSLTSTAIRVVHSGSGDATASSNAITITGTGPISTSATGSTVTVATSAANTINADSGSATASSNAFSIVGAGSVTTSATGSTITITGSGGGGGFTWNNTTGSTQSMSVNNGYVDNGSGTPTVYTLPATATVGDVVGIQGASSGLWSIAQNSGQTIYSNLASSTTGVSGSLSSTSQYDSVQLICITNNTDWAVLQSMGNLSIA